MALTCYIVNRSIYVFNDEMTGRLMLWMMIDDDVMDDVVNDDADERCYRVCVVGTVY